MASNFKSEVRNGSYHKVCVHCGESISLGECGKKQADFTLHHVVKHAKGPTFVNQPVKPTGHTSA